MTATPPATLRDWVGALDGLYDPSWAADWDAVGLVVGDPAATVEKALYAVDPTPAVVDEAEALGARLVVSHHPLLLRGVHGVAETTAKGWLVSRLVRAGIALFTAHTNADVAAPGVSDALADALGLVDVSPLRPTPADDGVKLVVFVPSDDFDTVVDALAAAGAGGLGAYRRCYWATEGIGSFVPQPGAEPAVGAVGEQAKVGEHRVEMLVPEPRLAEVLLALRRAHPYEEPAYDVLPTLVGHGRGLGRVGDLGSAVPAGELTRGLLDRLPRTPAGVRLAGDPLRLVRRIAVCGGAGDDLVGDALAAGADLLVTADLRHHIALEAVERGLLMVDAGHWATEWPWLADAAERTRSALAGQGHTVSTHVSSIVTDPWCLLPRD